MEAKVEALRTVKESAEQPEREAKERHLKAWEGKLRFKSISPSAVCNEHDITGSLVSFKLNIKYCLILIVLQVWLIRNA